jgi:hypothetical protein
MGKIISVRFRGSRLPRRLQNDGWWLVTPHVRSALTTLPKRNASKPKARSKSKPKPKYLTLVSSGK